MVAISQNGELLGSAYSEGGIAIVPLGEGCMDQTAFNYNPSANMDDGAPFHPEWSSVTNVMSGGKRSRRSRR